MGSSGHSLIDLNTKEPGQSQYHKSPNHHQSLQTVREAHKIVHLVFLFLTESCGLDNGHLDSHRHPMTVFVVSTLKQKYLTIFITLYTHTHILVKFQEGKKLNTCVQSAVSTKNPDSFTLHNSEV